MNALPFSPWIYELGNSYISSLALPLLAILIRFVIIEIYNGGFWLAYSRMRVRFGLAIAGLLVGEAAYRSWTWWGRLCANVAATTGNEQQCAWMVRRMVPMVPAVSIIIQVVSMLCMIRVLVPGVWGRRAWMLSALASLAWSLAWFSGWPAVIRWLESVLS